MTSKQERDKIMGCINETVKSGAQKKKACRLIGLTLRTIQRWEKNSDGDKRPDFERISSRALSVEEKNKVIEICNSNDYKDSSPNDERQLLFPVNDN